MYRALQIANYIIHVAKERGYEISNLHLQKILYYLQAESLVQTNQPLFEGRIEKWRLGPVIPEVYHEYKEYGSGPITNIADEIIFDENTLNIRTVKFSEEDIDPEIRENLEISIIELLKQNPFDLVDKTHHHEPWSKDRNRILNGEKEICYTNEEISEYFSKYPEKLVEVLGGGFKE